MISIEEAFGTTTGHQETIASIQRHLDEAEPLLGTGSPALATRAPSGNPAASASRPLQSREP
jgi:hypothetical protein